MKQKNTQLLVAGLILAALITKVFQIFYAIDFTTGFYKRKATFVGALLTWVVIAFCVAASLVARKAFSFVNNSLKTGFSTSVTSGILSVTLFFELLLENFDIRASSWQFYAMKTLGFLTAAYFLLILLSGLMQIDIPNILHTLPSFYMIIRIVCSFVNISSLSLIAENIFFMAALCCTLLFFVSYAAYYFIDERKNQVINIKATSAFSLCFITAISNILANIFGSNYNHIPFNSQLVLLALAIFMGNFVCDKCFKRVEK